MLKPAFRAFAVLALSAVALGQPITKSPWAASTPGRAAAENRYLRRISPTDPGGVLLISQDSRVLFEKAYGAINLDTLTPCTEKTLFHMDGAEDCAVRLLAVRLARAGELALDDQVSEVLPQLAKIPGATTIKDLVTGQARYIDLETLLHFRRRNERGRVPVSGALRALGRTRSLTGAADQDTQTLVLVAALEAATGRRVEALMQAHLFKPGAMDSAHWAKSPSTRVAGSASNYGRRRKSDGWFEEEATPLTGNGGWLWLGARDALGLCRLLLKEEERQPLSRGFLCLSPLQTPSCTHGESGIYLNKEDLLTIWVANNKGPSIGQVAPTMVASLVGWPFDSSVTLIARGGGGGSYGGVFGRNRFDGRWPEKTYQIFEIEQPLTLAQDAGGRLLASTPGFEPTLVRFRKEVRTEATFEGSISRTSRGGVLSATDPITGKPRVQRVSDEVTIRFELNPAGLPEPVSVSMETSARKTYSLNDLMVVSSPSRRPHEERGR